MPKVMLFRGNKVKGLNSTGSVALNCDSFAFSRLVLISTDVVKNIQFRVSDKKIDPFRS
jgi:hypothetical protein